MSPKNVMIIGISAQILFGNLTGLMRIYELYVVFRCLAAASCALMYTAGSTICEIYATFTSILNFATFFLQAAAKILHGNLIFLPKILVSDITSGTAKIITMLVFEFFWSVGLIVLPIFSLFSKDWWYMYIAISNPTILLIFFIK